MPDVPLTEKLLADAGGWAALKEARGIVAAGRVRDAMYEPPVLSAFVRGGEMEFRAGLRIGSKTDIENLCTCADSRRRALICAHSLAAGLAVIAGASAKPAPVAAAAPVVKAEAKVFSLVEGTPCTLHVILPPNFAAAWGKRNVMVVMEAEIAGARKPLGAIAPGTRLRVDDADLRLGEKWVALCGKPAAMGTLGHAEFCSLLGVLGGHRRVTFGKTNAVTVETQAARPTLALTRTPEGIRCACAELKGTLLVAGSAWLFDAAVFRPIAPGLPGPYLRLLEGPITIPAAAADAFVEREVPMLAEHFEITGDVAPSATRKAEAGTVTAHFEGSLNFLAARIVGNPRAAVERLRAFGFAGPDGKGEMMLKGEARILAFFAGGLPRLQREWTVTVGERFEHVTRDVTRIEPRLSVRGSGEQWFDLSYELADAAGERFSGSEIARLLESGQSHIKRGGKVAVFDSEMLDEFEHLLRDSAPAQVQPGVYRLDRRQAGAIELFTSENRVEVGGQGAWRDWATAARQLDRLRPIPLGPLEEVLRPYQKLGVYWLHFLAENGLGGILADEMGLGKTLQALAFLRTLAGKGPSLIVCPSTLVFNWAAEAAKWTPELTTLTLEGTERREKFHKIQTNDLVITSYALLRRDVQAYGGIQFAATVLDEAQHIKNPDSQNAQSASELRAQRRMVLTGTPVENSVRDIWSLMQFLMPGYLGTREDFRERYEKPIGTDPQCAEKGRLVRRLRPFLLRRTKAVVATELPEKIEQIAYAELNDAQTRTYSELLTATRRNLSELAQEKNASKARMTMLIALLRLRQAVCDLRLLGMETEEPSGKLSLLEELLDEAVDGGHRVLVFSQFAKMLGLIRESLEARGVEHCYLDGQTKDRGAVVERFQRGDVPVFLISLKAGGTGLNLTAADTVIHFDPWWNPAVEAQATDRAHRIGQKKVVTSYKIIARGTVEEKIVALQAKKKAVIAATVEGEEPLMEGLSLSEIEELLA